MDDTHNTGIEMDNKTPSQLLMKSADQCSYPACDCKMAAAPDPVECIKGLPRPFLFVGQEAGHWFAWRQERAHAADARRIAGPFSTREEAEALLGPPLVQPIDLLLKA